MDEQILQRLDAQDAKLDAIYESVEKTRKYFLWTMIVSLVMLLLPIILAVIAVPLISSAVSSFTAPMDMMMELSPQAMQGNGSQATPQDMDSLVQTLNAATQQLQQLQ